MKNVTTITTVAALLAAANAGAAVAAKEKAANPLAASLIQLPYKEKAEATAEGMDRFGKGYFYADSIHPDAKRPGFFLVVNGFDYHQPYEGVHATRELATVHCGKLRYNDILATAHFAADGSPLLLNDNPLPIEYGKWSDAEREERAAMQRTDPVVQAVCDRMDKLRTAK